LYNTFDEEYTNKASGACKRRKTVNITSTDEFCSNKETLNNVATATTSSELGSFNEVDELACYYGAFTTLEATFTAELKEQADRFRLLELAKDEAVHYSLHWRRKLTICSS
jgi:hypothetical protein